MLANASHPLINGRLTVEEDSEYIRLYGPCFSVLHYPDHYKYDQNKDIFICLDDRHEWHLGADVRRFAELSEKKYG